MKHTEEHAKGRTPIRPELLAGKLAAIRNHERPKLLHAITERPRLVELLWFLQFVSFQPGGLVKFVEDMTRELPGRFGTASLRKASTDALSFQQRIEICEEMPRDCWPDRGMNNEARDLLRLMVEGGETTTQDRALVTHETKAWTVETLRRPCLEQARAILPEFLQAVCIDKDKDFEPRIITASSGFCLSGEFAIHSRCETWFMDDPLGAVFEMMDRRAAAAQDRIAMTEVARLVFDRLDYALAERVMVRIEGGSRFGKTEALSAWVDMRPGLARLVRVPCDNSMVSLFRRIGEALGIDCSYGSNPSKLRERVEYVIQHGGLFLVLDEGHFLAPMNFTATTPPHRLNWIRTEIVDRGLPLALSVTPQAFRGAIDRFVKKTRYDMTQFFGRDFLPCVLPDVLSEDDLIAVARIHFPEMGENALGYIANEARLSQNYLQAVEAIARRARYLATKRQGRVALKDLQTAVSEVLPGRLKPEVDHSEEVPFAASRNATLTGFKRGVKPADSEALLDTRSLRSAGSDRVSPGRALVDA